MYRLKRGLPMSKHIPQENVTLKQSAVEQDVSDNVVSDKLLTNQVTKLSSEMTPERDLWPGIERAISHNSQKLPGKRNVNVFVPSAWAASIAMVMFISWFTFSPTTTERNLSTLVKVQAENSVTQGQLVSFMQQNFKQQKQTLLASYGQPKVDTLPVAMQKELTQLADARALISKALLTDENNADLLNLLDFTQQQELKLLQQLYRQYQVI